MRPQHDAAENGVALMENWLPLQQASMRPQHDAAENGQPDEETIPGTGASMRPQHDAAENDLA